MWYVKSVGTIVVAAACLSFLGNNAMARGAGQGEHEAGSGGGRVYRGGGGGYGYSGGGGGGQGQEGPTEPRERNTSPCRLISKRVWPS